MENCKLTLGLIEKKNNNYDNIQSLNINNTIVITDLIYICLLLISLIFKCFFFSDSSGQE